MNIDLNGKVAVITGSTGQLGRTIAQTLAACGADVFLHYFQNVSQAEKLAAAIRNTGRRAQIHQAALQQEDQVMAMAAACFSTFGTPHIIVNCAVSQYEWTTILDQDVRHFQDQFETCVLQHVLMAKAFLPEMIKRREGRFIGINTECAMQCFAGQGAYAAGKRGMDGIYRVLAKEVGPHQITVNQVAPGWVISDRDRENQTEVNPAYDQKVPLGHRVNDFDIANAVAFFASDMAANITGVYLPVSGGTVMPCI